MKQIPGIFCINLYEREDKYKQMCQTFKKHNLLHRVKWHRVHKSFKGGKYGCYESHLNVYKQALKLNLPYILVCEDDIQFKDNFESEMSKVMNLITDPNFKWDIIKLGDNHLILHDDSINEMLYRSKSNGFECYLINRSAMKKMVNIGIIDEHVDFVSLITFDNTYSFENVCIKLNISDSNNEYWTNEYFGVVSNYWIPLMYYLSQYSELGYTWGKYLNYLGYYIPPLGNAYKHHLYTKLNEIKKIFKDKYPTYRQYA